MVWLIHACREDSDVSCQPSDSVSLETASVECSTKCNVVDPRSRLDFDRAIRVPGVTL